MWHARILALQVGAVLKKMVGTVWEAYKVLLKGIGMCNPNSANRVAQWHLSEVTIAGGKTGGCQASSSTQVGAADSRLQLN